MFLVVEIPDIPMKEGIKALEYIRKKYKVKEDFLWKDGIAILFNMDRVAIKGPKIDNDNEKEIIAFKSKSSFNSSFVMFYEKINENNEKYIYCDTYVRINPINILKEIPWIKPIKIMNDFCTRPVKFISLSGFYDEIINLSYCGIFVEEKFHFVEEFLDFYEKKNIFIKNEKKLENINLFMKNVFNKNLLNVLVHSSSNPLVVFIPLEDKYMLLPQRIVDYVISKELMVFPKYNFSILEGFYFITNNSYYNLDGLLLTMNSRLEDLLISYERDINLISFNNFSGKEDYRDMGIRYDQKSFARARDEIDELHEINDKIDDFNSTKEDKLISLSLKLMEELNFNNLRKQHMIFLIKNYKNDYKTTLVEEYPELIGILSYYVYESYSNYNRNVHDALLSYSGEIKNEYGLLLYLTDKLYLLLELEQKKQLATSTKDPFGTKAIVDKFIELLLEYKKPLPKSLPVDLIDFFNKRIRIVFHNKYGDICYKVRKLQDKTFLIDYNDLLELEEILEFISFNTNYTQLKNIMNRISFCKESLDSNPDNKVDFLKQNISLSVEMQFIENILHNNYPSRPIINNMQYLSILKNFYHKITNIFIF